MPGIFTEYCGPDFYIWKGTGVPRSKIDAICLKHDRSYERFKNKHGYYPYLEWTTGDQVFLKSVTKLLKEHWHTTDYAPILGAYSWFNIKQDLHNAISLAKEAYRSLSKLLQSEQNNEMNVTWDVETHEKSMWNSHALRGGMLEKIKNEFNGKQQNGQLIVPATGSFQGEFALMFRDGEVMGAVFNGSSLAWKEQQQRYREQTDEEYKESERKQREDEAAEDELRHKEPKKPTEKPIEMELEPDGTPRMTPDTPDSFPFLPNNPNTTETGLPDPNAENGPTVANMSGMEVSNASRETPILKSKPSYGFQNTHTAILPVDFYLSYATRTWGTTAEAMPHLSIRMNSPWNILSDTTVSTATSSTTNVIHNRKVLPGDTNWANSQKFPYTVNQGNDEPRPAWRETWLQMYQAYTVLACHWSVTMTNETTGNDVNDNTICKYYYEAYGASDNTGRPPKDANLLDMAAWENINTVVIPCIRGKDNTGENAIAPQKPGTQTISGTWRPGMVQRNVKNDGDIKTWTDITAGGDAPNYNEILTIQFGKDPLSYGSHSIMGQIHVTLKYTVQFKDQSQYLRWPTQGKAGGQVIWPDTMVQGEDAIRIKNAAA